ncbi:MAG: putative photosynthetic complex assembly protein PuhE [Pseudomonadota bacterium]
MNALTAIIIAIAAWWVSTGLVIMVVRGLGGRSVALMIATAVAFLGLVLLWDARNETTQLAVYKGFFGALALWAWHEVTFLTGLIVGPRRVGITADVGGADRFYKAFLAIRDHELALFGTGLVLVVVFAGFDNPAGWLTYMLLWAMRLSTKLNVFLGAPNAVSEILPERLSYLTSYFRTDRTHSMFILSIAVITMVMTIFAYTAAQASGGQAVLWTLLATFAALALLEHLFLVLPIRDAALWWWAVADGDGALRAPELKKKEKQEAATLIGFADVGQFARVK